MKLRGKKIIILVENLYQDLEFWVPYYRLKEEGAEVTIVGSGSGRSYTSKYDYPVEVDREAREIDLAHYDPSASTSSGSTEYAFQ